MAFEFVSISDGKEAVTKAANVLFKKYYLDEDTENLSSPRLTYPTH